jgi:hypothetical protein
MCSVKPRRSGRVSEFLKVLSYPKFNLSALRINRSALFICPALNE